MKLKSYGSYEQTRRSLLQSSSLGEQLDLANGSQISLSKHIQRITGDVVTHDFIGVLNSP